MTTVTRTRGSAGEPLRYYFFDFTHGAHTHRVGVPHDAVERFVPPSPEFDFTDKARYLARQKAEREISGCMRRP